MENPIKMDDLGVPPILGNTQIFFKGVGSATNLGIFPEVLGPWNLGDYRSFSRVGVND